MTPLRIVLVYVAVGVAWILFSDRVLEALVRDPLALGRAQSAKGAFFVVATAALLYLLMRRQLAERRELDEEVRAVLDGMADAVLVIDDAPQVIDVNSAAVLLFGASHRRELLVPLAELLERVQLRYPDGRPVAFEEVASRRALGGEVVTGDEARLRRLDGRELFVSISSAPVQAGAAAPARLVVAVVRDISEVKRFEEMREEFLATAAHEFKTPLAVVKAYAQLMGKRGQGDPAALEVIGRQIERLTRMVHQLLEVSRFRLGSAELRRERFDLGALLAEVADGVQAHADGRRIVVEPSAVPVLGDRDRIGHVISNLLENAVRFSPQGGDVEALLARQGAEAIVSVRDHGLGIPAERQARVFERYYRAHAGTAQDYGGFGVGLDMSREIVSRHGGRIWFESAPGQGSTFSFALPVAPEECA
jgi:two-component system, OmpR family, phosphate regulon sensor histidine kinase PhoR